MTTPATPCPAHEHPAALAFHALNNARQITLNLPDATVEEDAERIAELLTTATEELAKLQQLYEQSEKDLAACIRSGTEREREITRLTTTHDERA